tara:strand:- start:19 stop:216 length:198 start_codon:yes stop_codon:yes gene_type:complete
LIFNKLVMAVGLVLALEGCIIALAPTYLEKILKVLLKSTVENRRIIGLSGLTLGTFLIWISEKLM